MDITAVLAGIAAGVTYSLTSFGKKKDQPFEWSKFFITLGIGVGTGVVSTMMNLPLEMAELYLVNLGAIPVLENVWKIIWRKMLGR